MRALVTGATGFAGRYLVKLLLEHGYDVCGTYHHVPLGYKNWDGVYLEELDITDKKIVRRVVEKFLPDEIYHLAAVAVTSGIAKEAYYTINFFGACNILDIAHDVVPNSRVLVVSSANAYGRVPEDCQPIREGRELWPVNHYAVAKAAADMAACAYAAEGLHVIRARPFNHTGPGQNDSFVCSRLARLVAEVSLGKRKPVIEVGNVEAARDFTDVRDVVGAYWLLLQKGRSGEAYNVCSQKLYSVKEIINILVEYAGLDVQLKTDPELLRRSDIPVLLGCREKIYNDTGWEPKILFEDTLRDLFNYWKQTISNER